MEITIPQWNCPYCLGRFASRDIFQRHLEPDRQLISRLLDRLQQASRPSCQRLQENTESSITSDRENNVDSIFTCPDSNCQSKPAYTKKDKLLRHFKSHVACNVKCCNLTFNRVNEFDKHLEECPTWKSKDIQTLGLKQQLHLDAATQLKEQQNRSQTHGRADATESSNETPGTFKHLKRKSVGEMEGIHPYHPRVFIISINNSESQSLKQR
ncbi:hypothetical protein BGZ57DRAFT_417278 [Hyaloscypha finlandica]|nr:hypothetical protein BGZ57DRAFT_417278 [Hyaloscypha finlandica]